MIKNRTSYRTPTDKQRVAAWVKFLKHDRDWDWEHILTVLDFKLGRVQEVLRHGHLVNGRKRADEIRAVRMLVKRVLADRYFDEIVTPHRTRWGRLTWREGKRTKKYVEMITYFPRAKTTAEKKQASREFYSILLRAEKDKQKDIDVLFKRMARNLQGWWD